MGRLRKGQVRAVIDSSNPFSSACRLREETILVPVDAQRYLFVLSHSILQRPVIGPPDTSHSHLGDERRELQAQTEQGH